MVDDSESLCDEVLIIVLSAYIRVHLRLVFLPVPFLPEKTDLVCFGSVFGDCRFGPDIAVGACRSQAPDWH